MFIVSILLFVISSSIHLYASSVKNRRLRNISKIFIIPSLILLYISLANPIENYFIIALLFSWFGDLLLIVPGRKFFTYGGISFIFSHVFFILSYSKHINEIGNNVYLIIATAIIYIVVTTIVFNHLIKYIPKILRIPMYGYLLANASMNCAAFTLLLSNKSIYSAIVYIGALFFFISDTNLFFVRFKKEIAKQNHFIVMLTYILAELLIVIGIIYI